uniref:Uncharacterized protein n=1 Tax=Lygus hesperus TaxID=30085 RepID=A0A0A9VTZ7_LYGHE
MQNMYTMLADQGNLLRRCVRTHDSVLHELYKLNTLSCDPNLVASQVWLSSTKSAAGGSPGLNSYCGAIPQSCELREQCQAHSSKRMLQRSSFYAVCDTLWLFHSFIYQCALTALIFLCFNISRFMFTQFLSEFLHGRVMYVFVFYSATLGQLHMHTHTYTHSTPRFKVVTSCDADGNYEGFTKPQLQAQASLLTNSMQSSALWKLVITVLAHLPYIVVIYAVQFHPPSH